MSWTIKTLPRNTTKYTTLYISEIQRHPSVEPSTTVQQITVPQSGIPVISVFWTPRHKTRVPQNGRNKTPLSHYALNNKMEGKDELLHHVCV